ncbi:unnamed protein product, partial [Polarella glacialis]
MVAAEESNLLPATPQQRSPPCHTSVPLGLEGLWRQREKDYFVDVADDGYVIASGLEIDESEVASIQQSCSSGDWLICTATDCLGECVAAGCSCNRFVNPAARDGFLRTAARRIADVAAGQTEVCYASLGCGFLRFDFCLLEHLLSIGVPVTTVHLVDPQYDPSEKAHGPHRVALSQFASWFSGLHRGVDARLGARGEVSVGSSKKTVTAECASPFTSDILVVGVVCPPRHKALPVAILQVDCSELTVVFDAQARLCLPCDYLARYGGLFCALTAREAPPVWLDPAVLVVPCRLSGGGIVMYIVKLPGIVPKVEQLAAGTRVCKARGASGVGSSGSTDAWGEACWLLPEFRLRRFKLQIRYFFAGKMADASSSSAAGGRGAAAASVGGSRTAAKLKAPALSSLTWQEVQAGLRRQAVGQVRLLPPLQPKPLPVCQEEPEVLRLQDKFRVCLIRAWWEGDRLGDCPEPAGRGLASTGAMTSVSDRRTPMDIDAELQSARGRIFDEHGATQAQHQLSQGQVDDAMDVDALVKGKGKHSGKGSWNSNRFQDSEKKKGGGNGYDQATQPKGPGNGGKGQQQQPVEATVEATGPGEGKGFTGACYRCGCTGHRAQECRQLLALEDTPWPQDSNQEDQGDVSALVGQSDWLMAVEEPLPPRRSAWDARAEAIRLGQDGEDVFRDTINSNLAWSDRRRTTPLAVAESNGDERMVTIDSGAFDHVCPMGFASWEPLVPGAPGPALITMTNGRRLRVNSKVIRVRHPILSVGKLQKQGYGLWFPPLGEEPQAGYIYRDAQRVPLVRGNNLFYLLTRLLYQPVRRRQMGEVIALPSSRRWMLFEWACERDSPLSQWFMDNGHAAVRLGLPETNLLDAAVVNSVVGQMIKAWRKGYAVVLWCTLPCTPWCAWQRGRIQQDRSESLEMVHQLRRAINAAMEAGVPLEIGFEWPRDGDGWRERRVETLLTEMPHTVLFDACRFNARTRAGHLLQKPWRLQTTTQRLVEPLGQLCQGGCEHGTRVGAEVTHLVQAIGEAIANNREELAPITKKSSADDRPERQRKTVSGRDAKTQIECERDANILYEATHLRFSPKCSTCVAGRAADRAHRQTASGPDDIPSVDLVYAFGYGLAVQATTKGRADKFVVRAVLRYLLEARLTGELRLRTDQEPAIQAFAQAVAAARGGSTVVEVTPAKSSSSLGCGERYIRSLMEQLRVITIQFRKLWNRALTPALLPWAVFHSSWLLNRFQTFHGKDTPFMAVQRHVYRGQVFPFGQPLMIRRTEDLMRLDPRWVAGVFLGKMPDSDEFIVGTREGVRYGRSVREVTDFPRDLVDKMEWRPLPGEPSAEQPVPVVRPAQRELGGANALRGRALRGFHAKVGPSSGCSACESPGGRARNKCCAARRAEWETAKRQRVLDEDESTSPAITNAQACPKSPPTVPRRRLWGKQHDPEEAIPLEVDDAEMSHDEETVQDAEMIQMGEKRGREGADEEGNEEFAGRVKTSEGSQDELAYVAKAGPPWYDSVDGRLLDEDRVKIGVKVEEDSFSRFDVFDEVKVADLEGQRPEDPQWWKKLLVAATWVLRDKGDRVRVRLVARQINFGDRQDTFAARPSTAGQRILLALAALKGYTPVVGDFGAAFLHESLDEEVLLDPPPPWKKEGIVWRLKRALYGLRRAPQLFQEFLAGVLGEMGFYRLKSDPAIFYLAAENVYIDIHVDDPLFVGPDAAVEKVIAALETKVKYKRGEEITEKSWVRYLGRERRKTKDGFKVRIPPKYVEEMLKELRLQDCRAVMTPFPTAAEVKGSEEPLPAEKASTYRKLVGQAMWMLPVRPDVSFAGKELGRHMSKPRDRDWAALKRLLRYFRGASDAELCMAANPMLPEEDLYGIVDASWASTPGCKSTSGGTLWYRGFLLGHYARTQPVIAQSSCESELYVLTTGVQELKMVYTDSSSAQAVTMRRGLGRLRHLAVKDLWLQEEVRSKRLKVMRVTTAENVADLLTKALLTQKGRHGGYNRRWNTWAAPAGAAGTASSSADAREQQRPVPPATRRAAAATATQVTNVDVTGAGVTADTRAPLGPQLDSASNEPTRQQSLATRRQIDCLSGLATGEASTRPPCFAQMQLCEFYVHPSSGWAGDRTSTHLTEASCLGKAAGMRVYVLELGDDESTIAGSAASLQRRCDFHELQGSEVAPPWTMMLEKPPSAWQALSQGSDPDEAFHAAVQRNLAWADARDGRRKSRQASCGPVADPSVEERGGAGTALEITSGDQIPPVAGELPSVQEGQEPGYAIAAGGQKLQVQGERARGHRGYETQGARHAVWTRRAAATSLGTLGLKTEAVG